MSKKVYRPYYLRRGWLKLTKQCEWCGDPFVYYSPLDEGGGPKRSVRYCSKRCIGEARWEGKRKLPNAATLRHLYEIERLSGPAIAKRYGCDHTSVYKALKAAGVAVDHASTRKCIVCGAPTHKVIVRRGDKIALTGRRCLKHQREKWNRDAQAWQHRKDPLQGTRKSGRKPIPRVCPKCGTDHPTTRAAVRCCFVHWRYFKGEVKAVGGEQQGLFEGGTHED